MNDSIPPIPSSASPINPIQIQYNNKIDIDNPCTVSEHLQDQPHQQQLLISVENHNNINCDHTNKLQQNSAISLSDQENYLNTTNMSSKKLQNQNRCNIAKNDTVPETRNSDKDYNEEKEFQRASKV